jgi:transcription antitermination factor NusG
MLGYQDATQKTLWESTGILPPAANWYAVHTRSNFERRVADQFTARGIEHYLPVYEETHQWKDRKRRVAIPLFAGYLFARFKESTPTKLQILQTTGTAHIVGQGGKCESVPEQEIEAIRTLLNSKERCFPHPFLEEGAWVRVRSGSLKGVIGRLVRIKQSARLVLSIDILSRSVAVEIDAGNVEPTTKHAA